MSKINYKNKVVWITGASSGIGEQMTYEFAKRGARLVLSAPSQEDLEKVKEKCALGEDKILVLPLDLSESDSFSQKYDLVKQTFGSCNVLINNAGISQRGLIRDTSIDIDRKIMEIDFFGHIALTKVVLPDMIQNQWGQIAVTSSIVGKFGFPLRSAYSAAKHALHGFFETLKIEEKENGIKVNFIIPGRIKTNISLHAIDGKGKEQNEMDKGLESGMDVEKAAKKIVNKLSRNKYQILVGGTELFMVYFRKWLPGLFFYLASKISAK